MKPRLLDLFCGAGGAAMGYHRAGFEVVGVDIKPQPEFPFTFYQGDAFEWWNVLIGEDVALGRRPGFDAIHASPPCQAYSSLRFLGKQGHIDHPALIEPTRERLIASGLPWVMENVIGSPLWNPLMLCGSAFGLGVRRHRLFESSHLIFGTPCRHADQPEPWAVYGDHHRNEPPKRGIRRASIDVAKVAMGIDWMPWKPLTQAIPPAYTEWIGRQLITALEQAA